MAAYESLIRERSSVDEPPPLSNTRFMPALKTLFAAFLCSTITVKGAELRVPENILFEAGIEYANPDNQHLQLNIARPKNSDHLLPCVLCIHSGGFRAGNRDSYNPLLIKLASSGYVAVSASYRLAPKYEFPAAIFDVKAAVRWQGKCRRVSNRCRPDWRHWGLRRWSPRPVSGCHRRHKTV